MQKFFFSLFLFFIVSYHSAWSQVEVPKRETRGLWVSTIHNLDWPSSRYASPKEQQEEFVRLVNLASSCHINTLYIQVRNASDAFYESSIEPWSQWLTGKQGQVPKPFWDPLAFMLEECHKRNIELHAWINPFRAVSHTDFSSVSKQHISKKKKEWCFQYDKTIYLDPGIPEVRAYICAVVKDITDRYDIDGIHFDDYFYPSETGGKFIDDNKSFFKYNEHGLNKEDWRRENINQLIDTVNQTIKECKSYVKFGISPIAVWRHDHRDPIYGSDTYGGQAAYDDLYADVRLWLEKGWIDYVAPQLYHRIGHKLADFSTLEKWWTANAFGKHVYTGHALYKLAKGEEQGWDSPKELIDQIKINRNNDKTTGISLYRALSYSINPWNIQDSLRQTYFKYPSLPAPMPWLDSIPPNAPDALRTTIEDTFVSLLWSAPHKAKDGDEAYQYIVYKFPAQTAIDFDDPKYILTITKQTGYLDRFIENKNCFYVIRALDRLHNESLGFLGYHYNPKN